MLLGVIYNGSLGHQHHSVLGYSTDISPQVLLAETNNYRTADHEAALELDPKLAAAAQAKANDMAMENYWSHITPSGVQPWSFITATGYKYEAAGENLAYGFATSTQVMTAWMNSAEHRANVLDADYQDVGFAIANSPNYQGNGPETIIVAEYAEPLGMINQSTGTFASTPVPLGTSTQPVSRLQLFDAGHWLELTMAALAGAAITLFFVRHALAWRRVLVKGEQFVLSHPLLDVLLMAAVVVAFVYAHTAGVIL